MKKMLFAAAVLIPIIIMLALLRPIFFPDKKPAANTLSAEEEEEGWQLLFDGKSTDNWHTYGGEGVGPAWRVIGGTLHLYVPERAGNKVQGGGDIVTDQEIEGDFEFKIDWNVGHLSNSGFFSL